MPPPTPKVGFNLGESPLALRPPPREAREQALPIAHPAYVVPPRTPSPSPPRVTNEHDAADGNLSYPQYPIPPPRIVPRRRPEGSSSDDDNRHDNRASPSASQPRSGAKPDGYGSATRAGSGHVDGGDDTWRRAAKPGGYGFATRAERAPTAPTQRLASLRALGGSFGYVNRDARAPRLREKDEGLETTMARARSMRAIEAFRQTAVPTCQTPQ